MIQRADAVFDPGNNSAKQSIHDCEKSKYVPEYFSKVEAVHGIDENFNSNHISTNEFITVAQFSSIKEDLTQRKLLKSLIF